MVESLSPDSVPMAASKQPGPRIVIWISEQCRWPEQNS